MEKTNNTEKVIGALLLGAAIGGALGILFAPDKGSETRRKISAKGDDLTNAMNDKFNDFLADVREEFESVKDKANELIQNGKSKVENFN